MSQHKLKTEAQKETSWDEAMTLHPIKGSTTSFSGTVYANWCGIIAAHGGVLVSLVLAAAKKYSLTRYPERQQPDPINSHIQFISAVPPGHITLSVKDISLGKRVSVYQVELLALDKKGVNRCCVLGIITQGNIGAEKGISLPTSATIPKEEIPDRETECEERIYSPLILKIAPVIATHRGFPVKGGQGNNYNDRFGKHVREAWYTRRDGLGYDVISLGQLLDSFPGAAANYFPNDLDSKLGITFPTLSMTTEIKKDPNGAKWLFLKLVTRKISNGRFDTDCYLVDEEGDLVALSKHVSLVNERRGSTPIDIKKVLKL